MRLDMNINELMEGFDDYSKNHTEAVKQSMAMLGIEAETFAREIVDTFVDKKGHSQGVDTGAFRDGIRSEVILDGFGFRLHDSVPYGIYHEFGTQAHFVPFFDESGNLTGLGQWAIRRFDLLGFTAIGKSGKKLKKPSRDTREEALKKMGGLIVQLDEMAPFRKTVEHIKTLTAKTFKEEHNF